MKQNNKKQVKSLTNISVKAKSGIIQTSHAIQKKKNITKPQLNKQKNLVLHDKNNSVTNKQIMKVGAKSIKQLKQKQKDALPVSKADIVPLTKIASTSAIEKKSKQNTDQVCRKREKCLKWKQKQKENKLKRLSEKKKGGSTNKKNAVSGEKTCIEAGNKSQGKQEIKLPKVAEDAVANWNQLQQVRT